MAIDPKTTTPRHDSIHHPAIDRAQPGDVLGIETDGETTELGDTDEDEEERRRDADEAARKAGD